MRSVFLPIVFLFLTSDHAYPIHDIVYETTDSWNYVFHGYYRVTKECEDYVRTIPVKYVDHVSDKYCVPGEGYYVVACTVVEIKSSGTLGKATIYVRDDMNDAEREVSLAHEYIHLYTICALNIRNGDQNHMCPLLWRCPGSVEQDVGTKLGIKEVEDDGFTGKCIPLPKR